MILNQNEKIHTLIDRIFHAIPEFNKSESYEGRTVTKIHEKMSSPKKDSHIIKSFCEYESAIDNLSSRKVHGGTKSNKNSKGNTLPWKWNSSTFCQTEEYAYLMDFKKTKGMIEDFSKYSREQAKLSMTYNWDPNKVIIFGKISYIDTTNKIVYLKNCQTHISKKGERFDFKILNKGGVDHFNEMLGQFVVISCIDESKSTEKRQFHKNCILNEPVIIKVEKL